MAKDCYGSKVPRISAPKKIVTGGTTLQRPATAKAPKNGKR